MAVCLEHHHPSESAKSSPPVESLEKRRRPLGFSHMQKMMPHAHVQKKIHIDPKEVSLASLLQNENLLGEVVSGVC